MPTASRSPAGRHEDRSGFKTPKGPIKIGQIDPSVVKNPVFINPKFPPISRCRAAAARVPVPPKPKGGMSNDEALALGLGLATVGVIAAAAASSHNAAAYDDDGCWYEKQLRHKKSGKAYYKKVLVCE